jgi:uncharacterized membrane protein YqaE (UPF0057 family)
MLWGRDCAAPGLRRQLPKMAGLPMDGTYVPTPASSEVISQEGLMDVVRILIAILLPPLGVFLQVGLGLHFWLNILLTLLGYIPGIIHAIWVIVKKK